MQDQNKLPLYKRLWIYQSERFPIFGHGLLISAFTFAAISFSRKWRDVEGFIPLSDFIIGITASITLFLLVRIFDEFKDKEDDAKYRSYLPVPRGLVTLGELRIIAWIIGVIQIVTISIFQTKMIVLYLVVIAYLLLMGKEFFVSKWLKEHQIWYICSHMVIIPLIDIYSSGLDWRLENESPH